MRNSVFLCSAIVTALTLTGCTTLPPMRDEDSYSKMNCNELDTEITAVQAHKSNADDNAGPGFMDVLAGLTAGLAAGSGRSDLMQQQRQVDASVAQGRATSKANADAHTNRLDLLNKIRTVKKCT
ncbi:MAG: hypothetical protein V4646_14905 [Pseudomonadota bacterium]